MLGTRDNGTSLAWLCSILVPLAARRKRGHFLEVDYKISPKTTEKSFNSAVTVRDMTVVVTQRLTIDKVRFDVCPIYGVLY